MNRRKYISSLLLLPLSFNSITLANPIALFGRRFAGRILAEFFKRLMKSGARGYSSSVVRTAIARTGGRAKNGRSIQEIFGKKRYEVKDKSGKAIGSAKVENDILMLRNNGNRILGYAQIENEGITLYAGDGKFISRFVKKGDRVVSYNEKGDYVGQIIDEIVEDQVKSYFVDRFGNKYDGIPLTLDDNTSIEFNDKNTRIVNNTLEIYNNNDEKVLYGKYENNKIILYNLQNEKHAEVTRDIYGTMKIYSASGNLTGTYK